MFIRIGKTWDAAKQQVLNFVLEVIAGDATTPVEGQTWYDSVAQTIKFKANSVIKNVLDRSTHTGTQTASTISDFDTQVRLSRLDQMAAPTADVSLNSRKLTNLADGVGANDAVNFSQLQSVLNGRQWKDPVRVGTTANIATLSGLLTVDGITLVSGDRVLVKDQTTGSQNGLYVAGSGAWTRSTDADNTSADSEIKTGMSVMVSEGTVNQDKQFTLTTNAPIVIGTTSLVFALTGTGTTYTGGTGISIAGSVISLDLNVATRKASGTIGDNAATQFTMTHSLNTLDIQIVVREISTGEQVIVPNRASSTSQCVVEFGYVIATNSHRVIVQG